MLLEVGQYAEFSGLYLFFPDNCVGVEVGIDESRPMHQILGLVLQEKWSIFHWSPLNLELSWKQIYLIKTNDLIIIIKIGLCPPSPNLFPVVGTMAHFKVISDDKSW